MVIKRSLLPQIKEKIQKGKVVILYGPRQVGKTFLLKRLEQDLKQKEEILFLNGENGRSI